MPGRSSGEDFRFPNGLPELSGASEVAAPAPGAGTPAEWTAKLEPLHRKLAGLVQKVIEQSKAVANLESEKKATAATVDHIARYLGRLGEAHFQLLGFEDLAERIRRLTRRRTRPGPKKPRKKRAKAGEEPA